jgi:predicted NAD/FAD-binding protein
MPSLTIAIIGAGAAGLAAAGDLARAGHSVTVFEAGAEVGGLAAGFKDPAWEWSIEKFYHHWFATDRAVLDLIAEIGHGDKVIFRSPTTSVWRPEGAFPMDRAVLPIGLLSRVVNVLGIPGLSLLDKLRLGAVGFLLTRYHNGVALEKHTAEAWLRRWMGTRVYDLLWRPLLIGKFSALYDQVNMAWMWARLYKRTPSWAPTRAASRPCWTTCAAVTASARPCAQYARAAHRAPGRPGGVRDGETLVFDRVLSTVGRVSLLRMVPDLRPPGQPGEEYADKVRALRSYARSGWSWP